MIRSEPTKSQGKQLLQELLAKGQRIFSMSDFITAAKSCRISRDQLKKIISILAQQGWLVRVRRGLYIANDPIAGQMSVHPFVIATHLIEPSVISHWSAAQQHGLTEQIPQIITASTTKKVITPSMRDQKRKKLSRKHTFEINGIHYEFITIQKKHLFGIEKIWVDEYSQIPITDKERTLLDILIYPKMFGGMGEAFGILEASLGTINVDKLVKYAVKYERKSVIKRLGWILESLGVDEKVLKSLLKSSIHYYCRLDPSGPAKGECDKRWMIQNNLKE